MQDEINSDILIVGGGPAGLLAAETAASAGIKTILIEKENQIGYPVHTSGAVDLKTMNDFNIPPEYYHLINRIRICSPHNSTIVNNDQPLGCVIDVTGVYRHLAQRAQNKGAKIMTGMEATQPILKQGSVIGCQAIADSNKPVKFNCNILIDASGYRASIAKKTGLHSGFTRFGAGSEYELLAPHCRQDEIVIVVGNRYAPSGYAWAFPWGEKRVRLGVGILHADSKADPKEHLSTFLKESALFNINLEDSKIVESHFGLVPANGMVDDLVGHGIICAGDAAGQASLIAGEGIRLSMRAGSLAGRISAKAILKGKYDKSDLIRYEQVFRADHGRNLSIGHALNLKMARWTDANWDARVEDIKAVPNEIILNLLQSEFSSWKFARWIITRPKFWSNIFYYGKKTILDRH